MTQLGASDIERLGPWFYDFELPGGVRTSPDLVDHLRTMHADRAAMLETAIGEAFPDGLGGARALDAGCHEGFYSHLLRSLGAGGVVGVDLREQNIEKARLVSEALGMDGLDWRVGNAEDLDRVLDQGERFTVSLAFGLLYHCENPVRVLRQIAAVTDRAIVIETQLAAEPTQDRVEWGRAGYTLPVDGGFAVVDEHALHPINNETGVSPLALCPSEAALRTVLSHCGFGRFTRIGAPESGNEQLTRGVRGVFLAVRTGDA